MRGGERKCLPIGIQTFRTIRRDGFYYVDKTAHIARMLDRGTHYFLSRPRRFGKSLLVDTLKELFEGNRELFEGLHICDRWDWSRTHPVVRLDFGRRICATPADLRATVMAQFDALEAGVPISWKYDTMPERFAHLLETLHRSTGRRVVVLVDEYDKPILDALHTPDLARGNRDRLRSLYGAVKALDAHVRFVFLTGVSKFSKVSLFSELNNLNDITLDPLYSALCGYTEVDLDDVFGAELDGLPRDAIRRWYNGYSWLGDEKVYNPFDILLLFDKRKFASHWFETGSPRFLIRTLVERGVLPLDLDGMIATEELLSAFDVGHMATEALLFQTGYLTIVAERRVDDSAYYELGYPNREVRQSLNQALLGKLAWSPSRQAGTQLRLGALLKAADFNGMATLLRSSFASIPYNWHVANDIARYEGYYASVFYAYFAATGVDVVVEDASAGGRLDMAVRAGGRVFLFEFKVVERAGRGSALGQLQERAYADKYRGMGEPIHLVGVEFSSESRRLVAFETALG